MLAYHIHFPPSISDLFSYIYSTLARSFALNMQWKNWKHLALDCCFPQHSNCTKIVVIALKCEKGPEIPGYCFHNSKQVEKRLHEKQDVVIMKLSPAPSRIERDCPLFFFMSKNCTSPESWQDKEHRRQRAAILLCTFRVMCSIHSLNILCCLHYRTCSSVTHNMNSADFFSNSIEAFSLLRKGTSHFSFWNHIIRWPLRDAPSWGNKQEEL